MRKLLLAAFTVFAIAAVPAQAAMVSEPLDQQEIQSVTLTAYILHCAPSEMRAAYSEWMLRRQSAQIRYGTIDIYVPQLIQILKKSGGELFCDRMNQTVDENIERIGFDKPLKPMRRFSQ